MAPRDDLTYLVFDAWKNGTGNPGGDTYLDQDRLNLLVKKIDDAIISAVVDVVNGSEVTAVTSPSDDLPAGSVEVLRDVSDLTTGLSLYLTPGTTAMHIIVATVTPTELAPNQAVVVVDPSAPLVAKKLVIGDPDGVSDPIVLTPAAGGGGAGSVSSVNDVDPDGSGNVTLTANDISAYTKSETNALLNAKANASTMDTALAGKADAAELKLIRHKTQNNAARNIDDTDMNRMIVCTGTVPLTVVSGLLAEGFFVVFSESGATTVVQGSGVTIKFLGSSGTVTVPNGETRTFTQISSNQWRAL